MKTAGKVALYFIGWCLFVALFGFTLDTLKIHLTGLQYDLFYLYPLIPVIVLAYSVPKLSKAAAMPPVSHQGYEVRIGFFLFLAIGALVVIGGSAYLTYVGMINSAASGTVMFVLVPSVLVLLRSVMRLRRRMRGIVFLGK